jgi:ketosteroid isomerase-like protein
MALDLTPLKPESSASIAQNQDGSEHLDATARFTNVWSKETGSWKLIRVISYDHL